MYVDKQLQLCDNQEMIGASAASDYGLYCINLSGVVGDIGSGTPLYVIINVTTAFASGSSTGTVVFAVVDEEDSTIDSGSAGIVQTKAILVTALTQGKVIAIPLPAGLITQQYLGLKTTYGTEEVTAGNIDAFVAIQPPLNP